MKTSVLEIVKTPILDGLMRRERAKIQPLTELSLDCKLQVRPEAIPLFVKETRERLAELGFANKLTKEIIEKELFSVPRSKKLYYTKKEQRIRILIFLITNFQQQFEALFERKKEHIRELPSPKTLPDESVVKISTWFDTFEQKRLYVTEIIAKTDFIPFMGHVSLVKDCTWERALRIFNAITEQDTYKTVYDRREELDKL